MGFNSGFKGLKKISLYYAGKIICPVVVPRPFKLSV